LTGAAILTEKIKDTRDALAALSVGKTIPVGNSDAGFYFNTRVLEASDFGVKFSLIDDLNSFFDLAISCLMFMLGSPIQVLRMQLHGSSNIFRKRMLSLHRC